VRLYRSDVLCWRRLLDPESIGKCSMVTFCKRTKHIGFGLGRGRVDVRSAFHYLDRSGSGFLTLEDWDPETFRDLMLFREVCLAQFCTMESAYLCALDTTGSGVISLEDLEKVLFEYEYTGNVARLYHALDVKQRNYVTVNEVRFLSSWNTAQHGPERFRISPGKLAIMASKKPKWRHQLQAQADALPTLTANSWGPAERATVPVFPAGLAFRQATLNISRTLDRQFKDPMRLTVQRDFRRMDFSDCDPSILRQHTNSDFSATPRQE
jgi:hypothetical protein